MPALLPASGPGADRNDRNVRYDVLILGTSARAAAFSALRSGLRPFCADSFADRDLAAACPVHRIDPAHAVRDFLAVAESLEPSPWYYTGGLENHPELVERISRRHRLWGVGAGALRAVRDPLRVAQALNAAGIPAPAVRRESRGLPRDGSWLVKPMASGGGRGIEPWTGSANRESAPSYFQQRIDGPSFSALFLGRADGARLVGITRQWMGIDGAPFTYRGNLGPWPIGPALAGRLQTLGDRLTAAFGLVGWFGVDYILADGLPWPVEINPRYPASLEIHELASGRSLLEEHRRACEGTRDETLSEEPNGGDLGDSFPPLLRGGSGGWNSAEPPRQCAPRLPTAQTPPGPPLARGGKGTGPRIQRGKGRHPGETSPSRAASEEAIIQEPGCPGRPVIAKRILYATRRSIIPEIPLDATDNGDRFAVPLIADVPQPGACLEPGEPAMTVFATAADPATCRARSLRLERSWLRRLGWLTPGRDAGAEIPRRW